MKEQKKITDSGIEVTLSGTTVIKKYSRTYICMISFSTPKEAKKEFGKFRKGRNEL